jgi:hypothetical protein
MHSTLSSGAEEAGLCGGFNLSAYQRFNSTKQELPLARILHHLVSA